MMYEVLYKYMFVFTFEEKHEVEMLSIFFFVCFSLARPCFYIDSLKARVSQHHSFIKNRCLLFIFLTV